MGRCKPLRMTNMRRRKLTFWILGLIVLLTAMALLCGKQKPAQRSGALAPPHVALNGENRYDLARDETRGGHTLERHIGKTDAELRERLDSESISTDSTYNDRATAEMAVGAAIREGSGRIGAWLRRPGGHSNLVLDYDGDAPVGRSMRRGDEQSFPCSHAVAILKFVAPSDYYVLTSYPECWRPK